EACRARGVRIEQADVRRVERSGAGFRLHAGGDPLLAERVVLAAGCDTAGLAASLGVELPIEAQPRHLFLSQPIGAGLLEPLVVSAERRFAAKQLADGRVMASDLSAAGDVETDRDAWRSRVARTVEELLPVLAHAPLPLLVSGEYDMTPDHQPVV